MLQQTWAKRLLYAALGTAAAAVLVMAFLGFVTESKQKKYERGYGQIKLGDAQDAVVAAMGQPDGIERCAYIPPSTATKEDKRYAEQCLEVYRYDLFLAPYYFVFDKSHRVMSKTQVVSP